MSKESRRDFMACYKTELRHQGLPLPESSTLTIVNQEMEPLVTSSKRAGCIPLIEVTSLTRRIANISAEDAASEILDHSVETIQKALKQMGPKREGEIREALIRLKLKITEGLRTINL